MTPAQKLAWFNLAVVVLTVVTVLILIPVLGPGAQGGFGLLGLLGLGPLFFRPKGARSSRTNGTKRSGAARC
jgi:hypothetical protein